MSYDQAKGKSGDEEGKAGGKLVTEKTDQVMGSCAGAGYGSLAFAGTDNTTQEKAHSSSIYAVENLLDNRITVPSAFDLM